MDFKEALEHIEGLGKMSDLKEEDFAPRGGIADVFAETAMMHGDKTTQIRRYFNAVKKMETDLKNKKGWGAVKADFYMLTPKFAYARGRTLISDDYFRFMMACLKKVDVGDDDEKEENFMKFVALFEAIVAYHKYHEETKKNVTSKYYGGGRR